MSDPIYRQCGLRVRSAIELALPETHDGHVDITAAWGDDITNSKAPPPGERLVTYDDGETVWYAGTRTDDRYLLRFYDCGEFVISADLDHVEVRRDPQGRHEVLSILLAGTCLSFILGLRGDTVLHASAVEIDGQALAFVGQSGRGKTTMAALMCAAGARLVTDDVLVVSSTRPVTCMGAASELRLRPKAVSIVADVDPSRTRMTEDDRLAYSPAPGPDEHLPLAGVVIPSPSQEASEVTVERIDPAEALFDLLEFPRVHGWEDPGVLQRDFTATTNLVNSIPVYEATIPWGPPFDPTVAGVIARLVGSPDDRL